MTTATTKPATPRDILLPLARLRVPAEGRVYLTLPDACRYTGLSVDTLRRRHHDNRLPFYPTGKGPHARVLVKRTDLDAMLVEAPGPRAA